MIVLEFNIRQLMFYKPYICPVLFQNFYKMHKNKLANGYVTRWKRFSHKGFAVFSSLKRNVNIGVLAVSTLTFANPEVAFSQNKATKEQINSYELEEIEVTASRVPLTQAESARLVTVLTQPDIQAAAVHSINDLLKYAVGVDVRQRGEFGIQTDISIRGGTFDQITLLLNGVNISSPQSGHLSADFPVSLEDIERIEILEGPAARVFGTSAFNGAINIITKKERQSHIEANLLTGAYGLLGTGVRGNYSNRQFTHQLSSQYNRSDGATSNSDFQTLKGFYSGLFSSKEVDVNWQLGYSDQKFGANTFYSAKFPNQYEKTRRYLGAIQAQTKGWFVFAPTVYWNRGYDNFQLTKGSPQFENFNRTDVYGANLNAYFHSFLGKTAFGMELRNEGILSTNLGKPLQEGQEVKIPGKKELYYTKKDNRTNIAYYLEQTLVLNKFSASLGVLANLNTWLDHKYSFYPGLDLAYRPHTDWKLFASWNKALRMPTFTDLYYKNPAQEGNIGLQPEETQAFSLGIKYSRPIIQTDLSLFYHKGKRMIDWVMYGEDDNYHSANFKLDNRGFETNTRIHFDTWLGEESWLKSVQFAYSYISQKRKDAVEIYKSSYALNYLRHKFTTQLQHQLFTNKLRLNWSFRWQDRMGDYLDYSNPDKTNGELRPYPSYALLDVRAQWSEKKYLIYVEANNLLDKTYFDLGSVPQPGFWLKAGIKLKLYL